MNKQAWGWSTSIDLKLCNPDKIRSSLKIEEFVIELCDLIEMKRFQDPVIVRFGADPVVCGYSLVQLIETSCITAHFAEEDNSIYLDVFSCKWYDPKVVGDFAMEFFNAQSYNSNTLERK